MKVKDVLIAMCNRAFNGLYLNDINRLYSKQDFDDIEAEYEEGQDRMIDALTMEQGDQLAKMEGAYQDRRYYVSEYGFKCGLYGAFRQFFGHTSPSDGGFQDLVVDDLMTMPKMKRHHENFEYIEMCNQIAAEIQATLSEEDQEHMVAICSTWDQRVYSAALLGFYCGYRAAYDIMEEIDPLVKVKAADKILLMEYHLGFIKPYSEVERLRDMNAA